MHTPDGRTASWEARTASTSYHMHMNQDRFYFQAYVNTRHWKQRQPPTLGCNLKPKRSCGVHFRLSCLFLRALIQRRSKLLVCNTKSIIPDRPAGRRGMLLARRLHNITEFICRWHISQLSCFQVGRSHTVRRGWTHVIVLSRIACPTVHHSAIVRNEVNQR